MTVNKKVGFLQEQGKDGSVSDSLIRLGSLIMLFVTIAYLAVSIWQYYRTLNYLIELVKQKAIDPNTLAVFMTALTVVDITVFGILISMAFFPKLIQKYAENGLLKKG